MGRRAKLVIPAAVTMAVVAIAGVWFFTVGYPVLDRFQFDCNNVLPPAGAGHQMIQTFTAPEDNLSRIDLRFDVVSFSERVGSGDLVFQIWEIGEDNQDGPPELVQKLREVRFPSRDAALFWMQRFEFEPIADSRGRTYAMRVTSAEPDETALRLLASSQDVYEGGQLFVDGQPQGADLSFALFHEGGAGAAVGRIKAFRPFPVNNAAVFTAVFLAAAAAVGWLLWYIVAGAAIEGEAASEGAGPAQDPAASEDTGRRQRKS